MRRISRNKKLSIAISGIIAAVILASGAWFYLWRSTPESLLYQVLAQETPDQISTSQEIFGNDARVDSESLVSKDGKTYQGEGYLECFGWSSTGETQITATVRQLQEQIYFQYNTIVFSGGDDEALNQQLNDSYKSVVNTWALLSAPDVTALGYKEKGVEFNLLGAVSSKMSAKEIADLLKQHQVITVVSHRDMKNAKPTVEYTLSIRQSAYERFMDSIEPQFPYSEEVLAQLFADDIQEITLVVDKESKTINYAEVTQFNLCAPLIAQLDEEALDYMSQKVDAETKTHSRPSTNIKNLSKPKDYISEEEFNALLVNQATKNE